MIFDSKISAGTLFILSRVPEFISSEACNLKDFISSDLNFERLYFVEGYQRVPDMLSPFEQLC